jgi:hypothetical protein
MLLAIIDVRFVVVMFLVVAIRTVEKNEKQDSHKKVEM